jgi:transcription antitermination factor NusG
VHIFVQTTEKKRHEVFEHIGVTKYVSLAGKICTLTEAEIERVKRLCSFEGELKIEQGLLNRGDEVEILEGHFIGLRGHLVTAGSKNKIKISIPSLNCFATLEMDINKVQKIIA